MSAIKSNPPRIVTNWRRFSYGRWRVPRGDIADAFSASTFPKVTVFIHENRLYTNGGFESSGWLEGTVSGYLLIPADEYQGAKDVPYSYEGREVTHRGQKFRLGEKIHFATSDPTLEEWRRQMRIFYADAGHFHAYSTYAEFLVRRFMPNSKTGREARWQEMAEFTERPMPQTQEEMRLLLANEIAPIEQKQQIEFVL